MDGQFMSISNMWTCVLFSAVIHLLLLAYGELHDAFSSSDMVHYTDIDYGVFRDAAIAITQGGSPFERPTYRYTPLLAWLLVPSTYSEYCASWGKLLFCTADVGNGLLIYQILRLQGDACAALFGAWMWLFNPLAVVVASRGNAESLVIALVLSALLLLLKGKTAWAGLLYGFAIHFKLYPIIYALILYLYLKKTGIHDENVTWYWNLLWPNVNRLKFILGAACGFCLPTWIFYHFYGWKYLHEAFLYHIQRQDVKHNFSPYCYLLYLSDSGTWMLTLPQLIIAVAFSFRYHHSGDLPVGLFLQTYAFVTFNKVCTSQYFLWFLSLLPLVWPRVKHQWRTLLTALILWASAQVVWLFAAYALEFQGRHTFLYIWIAGLMFFLSNICIMDYFIKVYGLT